MLTRHGTVSCPSIYIVHEIFEPVFSYALVMGRSIKKRCAAVVNVSIKSRDGEAMVLFRGALNIADNEIRGSFFNMAMSVC